MNKNNIGVLQAKVGQGEVRLGLGTRCGELNQSSDTELHGVCNSSFAQRFTIRSLMPLLELTVRQLAMSIV